VEACRIKNGKYSMTADQVAFWTMISSVASAAGTLTAAYIAFRAASAWRDGLKQQRADEFTIALNDCAAAIGRIVTRKNKNMALDTDEAWTSWRKLRIAYAVAGRYYPCLIGDFPAKGTEFMERMESYASQPAEPEKGNQLNNDFNRFGQTMTAKLR
jgi:hypothetical protein